MGGAYGRKKRNEKGIQNCGQIAKMEYSLEDLTVD
jgi:hypothetical protein